MSDQTQTNNEENTANGPDELTVLKERAERMGIKHSNNITAETLRKKIQEKLDGEKQEQNQAPNEVPNEKERSMTENEKKMQLRKELIEENLRLVRIRVANLDPKKGEIPGEILTTGNKYIGTVRKYVPFGDATDNGYHVPYCIYKMMKARKFLQITNKRDRRTGTNVTKTRMVNEFAIDVLPELTEEELKKLANAQAAAGSVGDNEDA